MTVDLLHNKIVKETVTEAFKNSVNGNLIPKLYNLYGVSLEGIQMYEDYIKDEFLKDGYWYYNIPLKAGEITKPLFRTITFASEMDNTYQNSVITFQITANAVQKNSNGDSALDAVWTEDGTPNN